MKAYVTNLGRVIALVIVGALAGLLAHANIHLGTTETGAITVAVAAVVTAALLALVAAAEKRYPWLTHIIPTKAKAPVPIAPPAAPPVTKAPRSPL